MVAEAPNVVISRLAKRREIVVRLVRGHQNFVCFVADQEDVLSLHGIAVVTERNQRTIFRETRFGICFSSRGQQGATVARRNLTGFPNQRDGRIRQAHTSSLGHRPNAVQRRPPRSQQGVMRNGVDLKGAVSQALHIDGGSEEDVQHLSCFRIDDGQACDGVRGIALVCESNNGRANVCAEDRVVGIVERQVTPFAREHVGRPWAERLHHEGLVKRLSPVRNAGQTV